MNAASKENSTGKGNAPKILSSDELFMGARELVIRHKDEFYRLSITKSGKLVLNK